MRRKFFILALIGFFFGIVVCELITIITGLASGHGVILCAGEFAERIGSTGGAIALQALLTGIYGAVCMGTVILYDIEHWPLALPSVIHYLIIEAMYVPLALFLGWERTFTGILVVMGIQLVCYFIIWLIIYLIYRKQVKELNALQQTLKEPKEKDERK